MSRIGGFVLNAPSPGPPACTIFASDARQTGREAKEENMAVSDIEAKAGGGILGAIERVGNRLPDPATLFLIASFPPGALVHMPAGS